MLTFNILMLPILSNPKYKGKISFQCCKQFFEYLHFKHLFSVQNSNYLLVKNVT